MYVLSLALLPILLLVAQQGETKPQEAKPDNKAPQYLLRVKADVGDAYYYDSVMEMHEVNGSESLTIKSNIVETMKRQYEEQQDWEVMMTLRETSSTRRLAGTLQALQMINRLPITVVRNDRARVLKMVVGDREISSRGSSNVCFPKSAVNIGDYWNAPVEAGGKVYQIRYVLRDVFNDRGRETAKIEGWYLPDQAAETVKPLVFWVDLETGRTVHSDGVSRLTTSGITFEVSQTLELKEVKRNPPPQLALRHKR